MGCKKFPAPDTTNICSQEMGEEIIGQNFCTLAGSNDDKRNDFCRALGTNEWVRSGRGKDCRYDSCDEKTKVDDGCCNGCCGIIGKGVTCKRVAFNADPLLCCLRDRACHSSSTDEFCFSDSGKKRTCNPVYRDQASNECKIQLYNYCTGVGVTDEVFTNRWLGTDIISGQSFSQPCYHAVYRNLYKGQAGACLAIPGVGYPDATGYVWVQDLMEGVFARYTQSGGNLDSRPGEEGNIQLNSMLWDICVQQPGLCEKALFRYCNNVTAESMTRRVGLQNWCGCYMRPEQYSRYTDLYQVSKECTPTCNAEGVIKVANGNGVGTKQCKQSLCIIDQISIDIAESRVGLEGGVNFNQLCSGCTQGSCTCLITGLDLTIIESEVGNISITQECKGHATCYKETTDENGVTTSAKIPCEEVPGEPNPYDEINKQSEQNRKDAISKRNWITIFIFIILTIIIIILWLNYRPYNPSEKITIVPINS